MPKNWIDRDDRLVGDCPAGPVHDDENVARLLNSEAWKNGEMSNAAFQKKYIWPPSDRAINNAAGQRDGESLLRLLGAPESDFLARSDRQYGTDSQGAAIAVVGAIRKITLPHDSSVRLFRVYEDPTDADEGHSVIRFDITHKTAWKIARGDLKETFRKI